MEVSELRLNNITIQSKLPLTTQVIINANNWKKNFKASRAYIKKNSLLYFMFWKSNNLKCKI